MAKFENFLCLEVSQITSKIWGYSPPPNKWASAKIDYFRWFLS